MKSNKGMTIISLIVYVIVLSIVIGSISAIMKSFYKNEQDASANSETPEEYTRFITYFTDDINSGKITEVTVLTDPETEIAYGIRLTFDDETLHEYARDNNGKIYCALEEKGFLIKKIELCKNVERYSFKYTSESKKIELILGLGARTYKNTFFVK